MINDKGLAFLFIINGMLASGRLDTTPVDDALAHAWDVAGKAVDLMNPVVVPPAPVANGPRRFVDDDPTAE